MPDNAPLRAQWRPPDEGKPLCTTRLSTIDGGQRRISESRYAPLWGLIVVWCHKAMPLKPNISNKVPPDGVRSRISPEFHGLVDDSLLRGPSYTVISFPGVRGDSTSIVDSKSLERALRKSPLAGDRLVVVAHNFTAEAREILDSLNAICFFSSDFYWSDESWADIRDKQSS